MLLRIIAMTTNVIGLINVNLLEFLAHFRNSTTRCLAVTGGGNGECGRLSQPSWLLGAL